MRSWFPEWPNRDHRSGETYAQNNRDHRRWASGAAPHFVHTVSICLAASLGMLIHSRSYQILTALKVSDEAGLTKSCGTRHGKYSPRKPVARARDSLLQRGSCAASLARLAGNNPKDVASTLKALHKTIDATFAVGSFL